MGFHVMIGQTNRQTDRQTDRDTEITTLYIDELLNSIKGLDSKKKDCGIVSGSFYPEMVKLVPQEVFIPRKFC